MSAPKLLNNVKFLQKCIVVDNEGRILALKRDPNDVRRPGCWDLPGGNYEEGEDINEMVRREVHEETGLVPKTIRPIYMASAFGKAKDGVTVIAICQVCEDWEGEVKLSHEHVEYRWVAPTVFMELETGDDGGFLKDSLKAYQQLLP